MAPTEQDYPQSPFNIETVLVTGGAGFIGSHTSTELLNRGYRVVVVDEMNDYYDIRIKERNLRELRKLKSDQDVFAFYKGDIGNEKFIKSVFERERPSWVCHLAARAGVRASLEDPRIYAHSNVVGTTNVLEMARLYGCRSVAMASSSSVYGDRKGLDHQDENELGEDGEPIHAFRETDAVVCPASPYAATKASCELIAYTFTKLYNLPIACLRFFTVYGPGGRPDMAPLKFVDLISRGMQIDRYGDGSAVRDFTYVTDIVDGTLRSMFQPQGFQIYNLGGGNPVTLGYFIRLIEDGLGTKANIRELPPQPGDVGRTHASTRKAQELLGFKAQVRIEDGVLKTIQWYRDFQAEVAREEAEEAGPRGPAVIGKRNSDSLEFEGMVPEPKHSVDMLLCTRLHGRDKLDDTQKQHLKQLLEVTLQVDNAMAAVAVEWTPARLGLLDDVTDFVDSITSRLMRRRVQIIPVANWGVTTALNACLHEAARMHATFIAFRSLEISATAETIEYLRDQVDSTTLVAGAALEGHQFEEGVHELSGANSPWNALSVWRVEKLAMTGFVAIGQGSLPGSSAGVEEVSTITVIQQLRSASGQQDAQAKLCMVRGVGWDTEWEDESRKESHQKKMASKKARAAEHLEKLQVKSGLVTHVAAP
mmetsp:Transcript_45773/g.74841  ORF Transcript_45773/g.74841 Transcript_45773/m.74841 type:complete len:649 (-) Transcript_45773:8-1954(-)